ncbi:hypothetical protein V8E36_006618 [Tilletia maclaganii]
MAAAFASNSGQELHMYYSVDKVGRGNEQRQLQNAAAHSAWLVPPKQAGDLHGRLPLVIGMPVFCTENIATELGVCNGADGVVAKITYTEERGKRFATSVEVDFPTFTSVEQTEFPNRVTVIPMKSTVQYQIPTSFKTFSATRWQIPLVPAFAYTCHNSQGRTLNRATVDLASAGDGADRTALAYVMLFRIRSLEGLTILRPFPFTVISTHASQQVRDELKRQDELSARTEEWAREQVQWWYKGEGDQEQQGNEEV